MKRDGNCESLWQHKTKDFETSTTMVPDKVFDVLIVGGGITGVTTALMLQNAGLSCILAEAQNIGFGTSGGTTAHLNTFFDTPYDKVIKNFGEDNARLLAQGAGAVMQLIQQNIKEHDIDCGFDKREGYIFALDEKQNDELEELVASTKKMGLPIGFVSNSPFPIPHLKVASIAGQAQFNPAQYIYGLAKAFEKAGGMIIQDCRVKGIKEEHPLIAETSKGTIKAVKALYATHIPPGVNLLHFRCAPYRSYAMAIKLKNDQYPIALGYDMNDPYHYYRTQNVAGQNYLIAGGEDHKTGHEKNTEACFRRLESYVKTYFEVDEIAFRWSSQYFEPADGLPYIGQLPGHEDNMYVATGFGGNGMIYGTLSALIFSDMMRGKKSPYEDLFAPGRAKPIAGFNNFVKEAADVVKELISGKFGIEGIKEVAELAAGEAKIVHYNEQTLALYKDEDHNLHAVNPACTHIKCTVAWNDVERSWDCPCHGSRFSIDGEMLTGPARKDLQRMDLEDKKN